MTIGGDADDWDECDAFGRSDHGPETGFQGSALLGNFALHRTSESAVVDVDSPAPMEVDADSGIEIISPLPQPVPSVSPAPVSLVTPGTTPATAPAPTSTPLPPPVCAGANDVAVDDGWACEKCTFQNPRQKSKCEMCGAQRPRLSRK